MTAFLTTGIGSMPRRSWLFSNQAGLDGKHDHYGKGGTWMLPEKLLSAAQDDATIIAINLQEKAVSRISPTALTVAGGWVPTAPCIMQVRSCCLVPALAAEYPIRKHCHLWKSRIKNCY